MSTENQKQLHGLTNRRDFLRAGAAVASVALLDLPGRSARAATSGGLLRAGLAHGSTTDTLDPGHFENGFMWMLGYMAFNNLTEIDAGGQLVGELATSWEPDATASRWEFELRRDVEWHDGKSLEADDVIATLNHHRGEATTSGVAPLVSDIDTITAQGRHRVVFQLKSGNVDFPAILAGQSFGIRQNKDGRIDTSSAIGTGGYVIESFEPGRSVEATRNPNYWKANRAHFAEVSVISIHDPTARVNALLSGSVDVIDGVDPKTAGHLRREPNVNVESVTGNLHYTFSMHTDQVPFDNNDVRLALKHAINRELLVETILRGYGSRGNDHPIGPAYRYHAADLEQRHYDPDKASWHLKQAGLQSLEVELSAADAAFAGAVDAATLYAESAAKSGVHIKVVREANDGYWANVWLTKPWVAVFWGGQPTAGAMLELAYSAESAWNDTKWKHERFNELLKVSKTEVDEDRRREQFREMQILVKDDGGAVVPMYADFIIAASGALGHDPIGGRLGLDDYRLAERWWRAG